MASGHRARPSLDMQHAVHAPAKPEIDAVGRINEQVRRVSMEMTRRSQDEGEDHGGKKEVEFVQSHGLTSPEADVLLQKWGRNELVEKVTPLWLVIFHLVSVSIIS